MTDKSPANLLEQSPFAPNGKESANHDVPLSASDVAALEQSLTSLQPNGNSDSAATNINTNSERDNDSASDSADGSQPAAITTDDGIREIPLIIERQIQTMLAKRVGLYWVACCSYFAMVMYFSQWLSNPEISAWEHFVDFAVDASHWAPALLLLTPLIIYDMLRTSQRFLAPVIQVRDQLQRMVGGQRGEQLEIPEEGFLRDLLETYEIVRQSPVADAVADAAEERAIDALLGGKK